MWFDSGIAGLFITSTLLYLGEDINSLVVSSFWHRCRGGKLLYKLYIFFYFFSFHIYLFFWYLFLLFLFLLFFLSFCTCTRVWSRTLSGRLCRVSSSFSENMAEEDNQSLHNENNENNHVRTLRDDMNPTRTSAPSFIVFPPDASHFKFKSGIIQLLPSCHGLDLENPYLHLREFEEVCNTYDDLNCSMNIIRWKLFPFSLKDKVKTWL